MKKFPEVIPIFPLSGVIYFPKTNLPLNIFEKKYLDLVKDAYSKDKLMGMVQSKKGNNSVYDVGCLGKISDFQKSNDGRILINLTGVSRFKILREISSEKLYREFKVDYQNFEEDIEKKFGVKEGTKLPDTLIEYCLKSDKLGDPHISTEHILNLGLCELNELELIEEYSLRINDVLRAIFYTIGINLIDFKLEFGICKKTKELILADEISPDTCRLWDLKTNKKLDKDRFRRDLGNVEDAYLEVLERLNLKFK